jgi:hypothetical protein
MKKFILLKISLITILPGTLFAQNENNPAPGERRNFIHIEAGYIYPEGTIKESVSIRQNISYFTPDQFSGGNVSSTISGLTLGMKYEYYFLKLKSGILTGLRYTGIDTEISGYTSHRSNFFYLRYSMHDSDTKFARVTSLTEDHYLLSIPLEIRFTAFQHKIQNLSFFATAGLEYSIINLKKGADIRFQDDAMETHKNAILDRISSPANKNYSTFYSSVGLRLGQAGRRNYNIEVLLPSLFLTGNNFYLVDADYFGGFKLSVQFPAGRQ